MYKDAIHVRTIVVDVDDIADLSADLMFNSSCSGMMILQIPCL